MEKNPVLSTIPKWILNAPLARFTREEILRQFRGFRDLDRYEGVMVVPWGNEDYLNGPYFEKYGMALDAARELGMKIIIWDENGFPSGHGGYRFAEQHPELAACQLEKREVPLLRGKAFTRATNDTERGAGFPTRENGMQNRGLENPRPVPLPRPFFFGGGVTPVS